jgi:hypothetical protein
MRRTLALVYGLGLFAGTPLFAQDVVTEWLRADPYAAGVVDHDPALPSPEAFFGRPLGARPLFSADLVRYAEALAAKSPRVVVERYGTSLQGRPLVVAYAGEPERLADRAKISARSPAFAGVVAPTTLPADDPALVWIGMGVHGDEASGGEAATLLLYRLAADRTPRGDVRRKRTLVAIDLAQNPDGRDRFVAGIVDRTVGAGIAHPAAFEHQQPWPPGRVNGHLFDLNRDWFLQTQPESVARVAFLRAFRPQVVLDVHEMGFENTYFFAGPPADPPSPFKGAAPRATVDVLAAAIRRGFDARGFTYFAGDLFPADYPGYGGSFPEFMGAAAMTLEQSNPLGVAIRRTDGTTTSLRDGAIRHASACLAVVEAATDDSEGIRRRAMEHRTEQEAARDDRGVFLLARTGTGENLDRLAATLARCGVAFEATTAAATVDATSLLHGAASRPTLPAGSLVVRTAQAARPLVRALLDPEVGPDPAFAAAETDRLRRKEPAEIYDVTAWNLPLLFGVDAYVAAGVPEGVRTAPSAGGPQPKPLPLDSSKPWIVRGGSLRALRTLAKLLAADVRVRVAPFEFSTEDASFGPGALVVLPEANDAARRAAAEAAVAEARGALDVSVVQGAHTRVGFDLGSPRLKALRKPSVVVAFGPPTDPYSAGAIRRFLAEELGLDAACVAVDRPLRRAFEDANTLVLPDGAPEAYEKALPADDVKAFLARGGCVVAVKGGAAYLGRAGLVPLKPAPADDAFANLKGPIVRGRLDPRHWLTLGMGDAAAIHLRGRGLGVLEGDGWSHVVRTEGEPAALLSGFLPPESRKYALDACVVATRKAHGGLVVAFGEDFTSRGATPGLAPIFARAVLTGASEAR